MRRFPSIGLCLVALCLGCSTAEDGIDFTADATPQNVPVVGAALHAANVAQNEVPAIPGQILESVIAPSSTVIVNTPNAGQNQEDRRVLRRIDAGLPLSAEDRIRTRREQRRDQSAAAVGQ
jgi:hypothetical protein